MTQQVTQLANRSRISHPGPVRDAHVAEEASAAFLRALGVDIDDPDLLLTPRRFANAYAELLTPREFDFATFANTEGYDELVVVRNIRVQSVCEHHLLPFVGVAHVAYLPGDRIAGLSKLPRLVEHFASRPQTQERLTVQIADALVDRLDPRGVGVLIEAEHTCMSLRGARDLSASTSTSALRGSIRENLSSRCEFLTLANGGSR